MTLSLRTCSAFLLLLLACVTTEPGPRAPAVRSPRWAHLQRAAALPWKDEGRCVVQEASHPWPVVVERCFHALDTRRVQFRDLEQRCPVALADAASVETLVGICLLTQPELVVGAVLVVGVVVVGFAIKAELDAYELRGNYPGDEETKTRPETKPVTSEPVGKRAPRPQESPGSDGPPPRPPESPAQARRPECEPIPVPHLGGNNLHNKCADKIPHNGFPGFDVLVNGKHFDALQLQLPVHVLWEVKTNDVETCNPFILRLEIDKQVREARRERDLAAACGYDFRIGVLSDTHKKALERAAPDLEDIIVIMNWCRNDPSESE